MMLFILPVLLFYGQARATGAVLSGTVTNAVTGAPVIGARIAVGSFVSWSVAGGVYSVNVDPPGTYTAVCSKPGYVTYSSVPVTLTQGSTVTLNIALWELANPPPGATAVLDTALQTVHLSWPPPEGPYELLYDDGIQDDFTVWATQGNINAVRFTPAGYPVEVTGGSVNIGTQANYPAGSNPLVPFQVAVYDATGPGGMPGTVIGGPIDVIPAQFGWITFTFTSPVPVISGNFYLGVIQGGNAPNAAGLAVDNTNPQLRSVSRFVTGQGPWVPAGGNFMIRATVSGPGGPMDLDAGGLSLLQYHVWRLRQGEELNPVIWTDLGTTADPFLTDPGWFNFPCGPYLWGISAVYSGNRISPVTFTNILPKCWTVTATFDISLSCPAGTPEGSQIKLTNQVYPDTVYTASPDTSGQAVIHHVWKGTYQVKVTKFGYVDKIFSTPMATDTSMSVYLLQKKPPPTGLEVNEKSLVAHWTPPEMKENLFLEDWSSGTFTTNGWTTEGGYNWVISAGQGNPLPSALFGWSPQVTDYSETLTSKELYGKHAPVVTLQWDITLDNYGTTTLNQMSVEVWNGAAWTTLTTYGNSSGSFPWTTGQADITAWAQDTFRIRFHATGGNSYDINGWYIDNVSVTGSESAQALSSCIIGYNVYLDNALIGFTPDIKYTIPGNLVQYGTMYNACVLAAYGSGYSAKDCQQFTSEFLWPPLELTADTAENVVIVAWRKPEMPDTGNQTITPPGLLGYKIYRNSVLIDSIGDPDTLIFYDLQMEPGTYNYEVTAVYDLTDYGFAGQFDESMAAGPAQVTITFGRPLPFFESWDMGTFTFNDWHFDPSQGNWAIRTSTGNPAPAAVFGWEPVVTNYSYSLESPSLDATPYHCASIHLDFDLKLQTQDSSGQEHLMVEVFYNNNWHLVATFNNFDDFNWTPVSINISNVAGKGFIIRFEAKGLSSAGLLNWQVDNIHVYAVCFGPRDLQADVQGYDVHLTWRPPDCAGGHMLLNEGFEEDDFPPAGWTQVITDAASTWSHTTPLSPVGVYQGNYSAGVLWDYVHQDEWLVANNVLVNGNLEFWSYAFQGSVHLDHYNVRISTDNGNAWTTLLDLSALPPFPSPSGYNQWEVPYSVDLSAYQGEVVNLAWEAVDGDGQGLWYSWAIDNCFIGSKKLTLAPGHCQKASDALLGYNVFRQDPGSQGFEKVNPNVISDTLYTDAGLAAGLYAYYVAPVFSECGESVTSDTVAADVITGIGSQTKAPIRVFPNPAHREVIIESACPVEGTEILDLRGTRVGHAKGQASLVQELDVSALPPGFYMLRIHTCSGIVVVKLAIY